MKFYNSIGPNPQIVRMFMAERGITIPAEMIDLPSGENRREDYLKVNPTGQTPALVLDDGSVVTEVLVICEYLDETQPGDPLLGATPEARAQSRRWTRWVDLNIAEPLANGFRFAEGLPMFQSRILCVPEAAPGLKAMTQDKVGWLDAQMAGRDYVGGDSFGMADIVLFCMIAFGNAVGQPLNPEYKNIGAWFARVGARPSAAA
jgi:glutathione S-transferase